MSTWISIVQRAVLHIRIPVQGQQVYGLPKVRILLEEPPLLSIIIPRPQILKPCIRVIALCIIPIEIRILHAPKRHLPIRIILVHIRHIFRYIRCSPSHCSFHSIWFRYSPPRTPRSKYCS